jgi:hypothetical protein
MVDHLFIIRVIGALFTFVLVSIGASMMKPWEDDEFGGAMAALTFLSLFWAALIGFYFPWFLFLFCIPLIAGMIAKVLGIGIGEREREKWQPPLTYLERLEHRLIPTIPRHEVEDTLVIYIEKIEDEVR